MDYAYTNRLIKVLARLIDLAGSIIFSPLRKKLPLTKDCKSIMVVKLDHLGDCFLITPLFESLKNCYKEAKIYVLCQSVTAPIFVNNPYIDEIITYDGHRFVRGRRDSTLKAFFGLFKKFREASMDLIIDPRGESFTSLLGALISAKWRIGFDKEEVGGFFYTHPLRYDKNAHETEKYKIILTTLDISNNLWQPEIYLSEDEKNTCADLLVKYGTYLTFICIHIGAGEAYKLWPWERFAQLIKEVWAVRKTQFIILGSQEDAEFAQNMMEELKDINTLNLIGKLSIRQAYYVISGAEGFIGNDSVLAHFSGAMEIPTVQLINGAVNANRWQAPGPYTEIVTGINHKHKCAYGKCKYPCPHMEEISVKNVFDKFMKLQERYESIDS